MPQVCARISAHLYQELELKAQELNTEKSALLRDFIRIGLSSLKTNDIISSDLTALLKQNIHYSILSHCLIDLAVSEYVENGNEICEKARSKAEKLLNNLLLKFSKRSFEPTELIKVNLEPKKNNE